MAARSFPVEVNPAVLQWARESAGYSIQEVAGRIQESQDALIAWESGRKRPRWSVLHKLSAVYKRPVASLLLPAPPDDRPLPTDFRTLPNARRTLSPKTRYAIRMARWFLRTAADLEERLGMATHFEPSRIRPSDNPEKVAHESRERLAVSLEEQTGWPDLRHAFNRWRTAIEGQDVFVFQSKLPVEEVRGFSLFESQRPAIVLNQSDGVSARIFSLFHEYAHLLLADPGICLPEEGVTSHSKRIETFCNRFAAGFLIPRADLERHLPSDPDDQSIHALARRYRVSRYVVLGRLRGLGSISNQTYHQIARRWQTRAEGVSASAKSQHGGPSATVRCLSERGRPFVSLVLQAAKREVITINDAAAYLGTKLKDLDKLTAKVT